jgi:hypothetical protein
VPRFTDNEGCDWVVSINVATVKRVRSMLDVDLLEILGGKLLDRLIVDPVLLVDVVYVVCKPEADDAAINSEEFGRRMSGDAIAAATRALLEALASFFPSPKDRANLRAVLTATDKALDTARDRVAEELASGILDRALGTAARGP